MSGSPHGVRGAVQCWPCTRTVDTTRVIATTRLRMPHLPFVSERPRADYMADRRLSVRLNRNCDRRVAAYALITRSAEAGNMAFEPEQPAEPTWQPNRIDIGR